jgi:phosphate acetyltransferase
MDQDANRRHGKYERLIARLRTSAPIATAVVHPCDESALKGAMEPAGAGIIAPVLVGPLGRIRALAEQHGLDLSPFRLVDQPHSHAAAAKAVELVRLGEAAALMKGSLHTDELLAAVVKRDTGIRTERRLSHVFIMDVPSYHKPLCITDAAVNIFPTLEDKADIVRNAIDLAHALGSNGPRSPSSRRWRP